METYGFSPFLECSSKGDKRFSALYAKVNGRSIEEQYQAAKVFEGNITRLHWRQAKGRKAINAEECAELYARLWKQYISEHPELLDVLRKASGLSDMFAREGRINQAQVLWEIRNEPEWKEVTSIEAVEFLKAEGLSRDLWASLINSARNKIGETIWGGHVAIKCETNLEHIFSLDWFVTKITSSRLTETGSMLPTTKA